MYQHDFRLQQGQTTLRGITVAKLRQLLEDAPQDALVVLSHDPEGNRFTPLYELEKKPGLWFDPDYEEVIGGDATQAEAGRVRCVVAWPS